MRDKEALGGVVLGVVLGVVVGVILGVVVYGVPPFMWGQPSYEGGAVRACMPDVSQATVRCGDWAAAEVMRTVFEGPMAPQTLCGACVTRMLCM